MKSANRIVARVVSSLIASVLFVAPALADSITLTPTALGLPGEVNVGFNYVVNANLSLSAITRRGQDCCPDGIPGTVFFTSDGAGVQSDEFKGTDSFGFPKYGGSKEISGVKKHKFESLVLEFTTAVDPSSVILDLERYQLLSDDAHLTLALLGGGFAVLLPDLLELTFPPPTGSSQLVVDLGDPAFASLISGIGPLTEIEVRSLGDHCVVNTVTFVTVPEPATFLLLGLGLAALAASRRKRRKS